MRNVQIWQQYVLLGNQIQYQFLILSILDRALACLDPQYGVLLLLFRRLYKKNILFFRS